MENGIYRAWAYKCLTGKCHNPLSNSDLVETTWCSSISSSRTTAGMRYISANLWPSGYRLAVGGCGTSQHVPKIGPLDLHTTGPERRGIPFCYTFRVRMQSPTNGILGCKTSRTRQDKANAYPISVEVDWTKSSGISCIQ